MASDNKVFALPIGERERGATRLADEGFGGIWAAQESSRVRAHCAWAPEEECTRDGGKR